MKIVRVLLMGMIAFTLIACSGSPSTVTDVTAREGDGQVTISWDAVPGVTAYNIYWSTTSGVTKTAGTKIANATSPYVHTGLTNGTTYYYVVTAVSLSGESRASSQVSKEAGLAKYDKIVPDYESSFSEWNGPNVIKAKQLFSAASPLNIQGLRGDFDFTRMKDKKNDIIHISPNINEKEWDLQFGYLFDDERMKLKVIEGQTIVFIVRARSSKALNQKVQLFIQDYGTNWERNDVAVDQNEWKDYIVTKKIRPSVTKIAMGLSWKPNSSNEWLEIGRIRVFVEK